MASLAMLFAFMAPSQAATAWYEEHCQDFNTGLLNAHHVRLCAGVRYTVQDDGDGLVVLSETFRVDEGCGAGSLNGLSRNPTLYDNAIMTHRPSGTYQAQLHGSNFCAGDAWNVRLAGPDSGRMEVILFSSVNDDGPNEHRKFDFFVCRNNAC